MRKQTKIAAVVSAAALLALGASMTSFAASKGTWMMVDGEWYCYDKNGDAYENVFCSSNGKEYYVGGDGQLVRSSWVEYDGSYYFVNSSGAKITNDWRLTTPYEDEGADEEWYYFKSNGKRAEGEKITYKGKTYYFDSDGQMLTGWVTYDNNANVDEANTFESSKTFYCDETGARVEKDWVYSVEPGVEDDDADADEYWYYFKSSGKAQTGKGTNIKGQTYLFDDNGRMLTGWVAGTKVSTASNAKMAYKEIGDENSTEVLSTYKSGDVYFCGDEDDGHAKKNKWFQTWRPSEYDEADEDNDQYWYYIDKNGKVYIPSISASDSNAIKGDKYKLTDAALEHKDTLGSITKKKVNSKDYFFNENGEMLCQFINVTNGDADLPAGMYYFGGANDGSMKTGAQTVKDDNGDTYKFYFGTKNSGAEKKGVGITGNKSNKLYYKGLLLTADDYKYQIATVDGYKFIVNKNGSIQHSVVEYKEDSDVLINAKSAKFNTNGVADEYKYSIDETTTYTNLVDEINIHEVMTLN